LGPKTDADNKPKAVRLPFFFLEKKSFSISYYVQLKLITNHKS